MHIPHLMPGLDRDCPVGSSRYVCQSNGFEGCCEVDPCDLASCPSRPKSPMDDAATTVNDRATKTAITTVTSPITVTVSTSSSGALSTSSSSSSSSSGTLTGEATSPTASPTQPTAPQAPETRSGTGAIETPAGIIGSEETPGVIQSGDRPAQLPAGAIAGIVLAGALVILVVCALLWWWACWRRRARREEQHRHHARGLTWTSEPCYYGPGDDSAITAGTAAPMMGYSAVIEADRGRAAAVPAAAAATPARQESHHSHHREPLSPCQHFSDSKSYMVVPIGMAHPCRPTINTTTLPGGHARWESPDDIRWCSDANSDLVSPISPDGGSIAPSRQGSRYTREAALPSLLLLSPACSHQQPPQPQQQHPQQADSIPKFELDGREISPPPQPQRHRDSSAGSAHPAPLRLGSGSVRTQPLRRVPRLTRRASDAGHYPSGIPHQQSVVVAVPSPRSHSRSLSGGGGRYYTVLGQHQEQQQQQQQQPPPVYQRRSSSQDRVYENYRDSYTCGEVMPRATLRATRHEVEAGVHAGSWSVLSPA